MKEKILHALLIVLLLYEATAESEYEFDDCPSSLSWSPNFYSIEIATGDDTFFDGRVRIEGHFTNDTDKILLHSRVDVSEAFITIDSKKTEINLESSFYNISAQTLTLSLNSTWLQGVEFMLNLKYRGRLQEKHGLYLSYYDVEGTEAVLSTDFQPNGARLVFPCLDLPRFKAIFELKVSRFENQTTVSNMPLKSTSPPDITVQNQVWDTFQATPKMSTYLLNFVSAYNYTSASLGEENRLWYPSGFDRKVKYFKEISPFLFKNIKSFLNLNYSLPKLDHIIVPTKLPIAMENWGLITYRVGFMHEKGQSHSTQDETVFVMYIAHEIIHQWFGNLVTCRYWCYAWLNEGISTYLSVLVLNELFPRSHVLNFFIDEGVWQILIDDSIYPIQLVDDTRCCENEPTHWTISINTYHKGAAILHMTAKTLMNTEKFKEGLVQYVKDNQYNSVVEKNLWDQLEAKIEKNVLPDGVNLYKVMETWTHNEGYPVLTLFRHKSNGSIAVSQERFYLFDKHANYTNFWWVPLTFTTSKVKNFNDLRVKEWLRPTPELQTLEATLGEDEWIIFNLQQSGYYRVNYDQQTWQLIIDHLLNEDIDEIHPLNRAQLVNDAFTLASIRLIKYSIPLNLSLYVTKELDYAPISAVTSNLASIYKQAKRSPIYTKLNKFFKYVLSNAYKHVTSKDYVVTDLMTKKLKLNVVLDACRQDVLHCLHQALQAVQLIINKTKSESDIPYEFKHLLWCSAAKIGNMEVFNFIKSRYIEVEDLDEKLVYFDGLLCTRGEEPIKSFTRDIVFKAEYLKDNNVVELFISFCHPQTVCTMLDYLIEHYNEILTLHGKEVIYQFTLGLQSSTNDNNCANKLKQFMSDYKISLKDRYKNQWGDQNTKDIEDWFESRNYDFVENPDDYLKPISPNVFLSKFDLKIYDV